MRKMQKDINNEHGLPIFDVQGTDNIDNTSKRYPEQRFYLFIFEREIFLSSTSYL